MRSSVRPDRNGPSKPMRGHSGTRSRKGAPVPVSGETLPISLIVLDSGLQDPGTSLSGNLVEVRDRHFPLGERSSGMI